MMESNKICVLEKGRLVEEGSPKVADHKGFFFSDLLKIFKAVSQCLSLVVLFQNINVERSVSGASQPD